MPDYGPLPNIQVHYNLPADEKQIVASLRTLQRDLSEAMQTINSLTRERDDARAELRLLKAHASRDTPARHRRNQSIEEDLFDLSSPLQDSPRPRDPQSKKETADQKQTQVSDDARVIEPAIAPADRPRNHSGKHMRELPKRSQSVADDTEQSILPEENHTAVSNMSRRRRRASADENMTSAYILPDITMDNPNSPKVSKAAQAVIHSEDPEHVNNCDVCHRLTRHIKATERRDSRQKSREEAGTRSVPGHRHVAAPAPVKASDAAPRIADFALAAPSPPTRVAPGRQPDYTAVLAGFSTDDSYIGDATIRPKLPPSHALARVRALMDAQFKRAKERHEMAWRRYDNIDAPMSSRRHAEISREMQHWAEKMEECRVHLDHLRDVEEGMGREV